MNDQPITPKGLQPKDLRHSLGRRPTPMSALVSTPATPATPSPTLPPGPAPASHDEPTPEPTAGPRSTSRRTDRPDARTPTRRRPHTVFYLPVDLSDLLRDQARRRNKTNADLIFDAIEATLTDLPHLLAAQPAEVGGVFTRTTKTRPVGQKVQISGRIHDGNLAIIDRLVAEHGAESRSHLVEVALRAYLSTSGSAPAR